MKFDEDTFRSAGLVWMRDKDRLRIMVPAHSHVVECLVRDDGSLDLVPERSHNHRALIAHLKGR